LLAGTFLPSRPDYTLAGRTTVRAAAQQSYVAPVPVVGSDTSNRHCRSSYSRRNNSGRSRSRQTDLYTAFRERHYDLLVETPPPHNPDFLPRSATTSPLPCQTSGRFDRWSSADLSGASAASVSQVPHASAVVVSDDDDDDSDIPFVAALRISNEDAGDIEQERRFAGGIPVVTGLAEETPPAHPVLRRPPALDVSSSRASSVSQNNNTVTPAAGRRTKEEELPSRSWFASDRARATPKPDAREGSSRIPWEEPRHASGNHARGLGGSSSNNNHRRSLEQNTTTTPSGNRCSSWSRVSFRAKETVLETRRSLTKKLGSKNDNNSSSGSKPIPVREKENLAFQEEHCLAKSSYELAKEQKALSKRIARSSKDLAVAGQRNNKSETKRAVLPRSRRW